MGFPEPYWFDHKKTLFFVSTFTGWKRFIRKSHKKLFYNFIRISYSHREGEIKLY